MHPTNHAGALLSGAGVLLFLLVGVIALAVYFLPSIIAIKRRVVNLGSVIAINVLLGWSLIGWVVALAMALRTNPPWVGGPGPGGYGPGGYPPGGYGPRGYPPGGYGPPTGPAPGAPPVG